MSPHELNRDEMRELFLEHIRTMVGYWEREERAPSVREKLEGLAFSMLVAIDGESGLPAFHLVPRPHPDDKAFSQENGENWWPDPNGLEHDISGELHERFHEPKKADAP